ncbi:MAG: dienelactone hydrolase family protein, partial [Planctomycetales bacterium]|nr:dienelactone hydrolase family protein [Planctomycetales bacterium]
VPTGGAPLADVVAIPDADHTPEQIVGLAEGVAPASQFARRLAECKCRVLVPALISRDYQARNGRAKMTNREYVYRSAFELGRHLIGYELQEVLAGVDWFDRDANRAKRDARIGVVGYGEGGMLALYAGALDTRIDATCVLGFFGPRETMWREPLDRNVFGLLRDFGAAELAAMTTPRALVVEDSDVPHVELPSEGGAPARLARPDRAAVERERDRWKKLVPAIGGRSVESFHLQTAGADVATGDTLGRFVHLINPAFRRPDASADAPVPVGPPLSAAERQRRQLSELDRHNQALLAESAYVRQARFWDKLDTSGPQAYAKSIAPFREEFKRDVIGAFDDKPLPPRPRTRLAYDEPKWTGYEVALDLWPDVICYGILCLPKDLERDGSDKRPVVVCQHGLEGRPQDVVTGDSRSYHDFASKLCERGFITFAPQNLYIGKDDFRTLQRKANPLGKTLFSVIVPQHQQIIDWLKTQPYVDRDRFAFYGLSYGGKSAMRIPPLVADYRAAICSADFNEWVDKNASTRGPYSYVWTGEYEIFEWDLGGRFNYAEMAALIAPRPFMVERGHFDGVATDENVAYEFAKVRRLYRARLGLPEDHCQLEWFVGPHTIHGKGTFSFLHRHLQWPE